jgi:hypothetical protein
MRSSGRSGAALLALSAAILGAAVAAKLFPIVLLPLLVAVTARRQGWLAAATFGAVGLLAAAVLLLPMLPAGVAANGQGGNAVANRDEVSAPANTKVIEPSQRSTNGLVVFLRQWEINDLIFLVVYENLVPPTGTPQAVDQNPSAPIPWFSVVPNRWRNAIVTPLAARSNVPPREAAFFLARGITLAIFVGIAAWVGYWAARSDNRAIWLEAAFLTLAWFWALSPTQNPWYWTWAMPLLPFARNRAWFAVSGLLLLYYLRFWLAVHDVDWGYWGLADRGENLFHFVVVPIEQGIWLTWLLLETLFRGKSTSV